MKWKNGGALSFNGSSAWVTVLDAPDLRLSTGMTVEAWVRPTARTGLQAVSTSAAVAGASPPVQLKVVIVRWTLRSAVGFSIDGSAFSAAARAFAWSGRSE